MPKGYIGKGDQSVFKQEEKMRAERKRQEEERREREQNRQEMERLKKRPARVITPFDMDAE